MRSQYVTIFYDLLAEHSNRTGFQMPDSLASYLVELLAQRIDNVDIIPDPSFAECYLKLQQTKNVTYIREYADTCLFFTSLLPEYGHRRGLSMDYYATLGISSYYTAADLSMDDRYTQLGNWFYYLQKFLNTAIHPDKRLELFKI